MSYVNVPLKFRRGIVQRNKGAVPRRKIRSISKNCWCSAHPSWKGDLAMYMYRSRSNIGRGNLAVGRCPAMVIRIPTPSIPRRLDTGGGKLCFCCKKESKDRYLQGSDHAIMRQDLHDDYGEDRYLLGVLESSIHYQMRDSEKL